MGKFTVCVCILAMIFPAFAKERKSENQDPIAWGVLSENDGCVIFKEYRKNTATFWFVAISTKSTGALEVIETQDYKLEQTKWIETQENMDQLQRLANEGPPEIRQDPGEVFRRTTRKGEGDVPAAA